MWSVSIRLVSISKSVMDSVSKCVVNFNFLIQSWSQWGDSYSILECMMKHVVSSVAGEAFRVQVQHIALSVSKCRANGEFRNYS